MSIYIDTHCHLNHTDYADLPEVLKRAEAEDVRQILCVGYDLESSAQALKLAQETEIIFAAVGVHPHDATTFTQDAENQIRELAEDRKRVIAIGETGLDYYYDHSPRDVQRQAFRMHIDLAQELELPLIIHSRDAYDDVLEILEEKGLPKRGAVMHCFLGNAEIARRSLALGCYLGVDGPITFKNSDALRLVVADLPLDRLLLETDAPYLTPRPHRGHRNEPSYLPLIATALADLLGITVEEVKAQTSKNACDLFGFKG